METSADIDYLGIIRRGLPAASGPPRRIVVVGAGMSGLAAGYELVRAGHEVEILEAQSRVGGRVLTLREPFAPGLHAEAGAMRIPSSHALTLACVERFGLPTFPFTMGNPMTYYAFQGRKVRARDGEADPDLLAFPVARHERGRSANACWDAALAPLLGRLRAGGAAAWDEIVATHDQYSVREFLETLGWSEGMIEMYGLLQNQEATMNSSFLEVLREEAGDCFRDVVQIEGGSDRLPLAFLPALARHIRFGARMVAIDQDDAGVTVHYQTAATRASALADAAILTLPFPALRHVETLKPFSPGKQRAIRQLHYDASAKIFMQFRRRFWEEDEGIYGGGTVTDLAIRNVFYPEHGRETGRGVLLASYTWAEDAQRWGSLSPSDRIAQALENLARIHPQAPAEFEVGASKMWHDDEFAGGAFALFDPGQQTLLHRHIVATEGRIHFAGEHASLAHAWIQGAIESGLRAAWEIHTGAR
jgi:monoamine oxidase